MTDEEIAATGRGVTAGERLERSYRERQILEATSEPTEVDRHVRGPSTPKGEPTAKELEAIAAVRELGSIAAAATRLGLTRHAVDNRLRKAKERGVVFDWPKPYARAAIETPVELQRESEVAQVFRFPDALDELDRDLDAGSRRRYVDILLAKLESADVGQALLMAPLLDRLERILGIEARA